MLDFRHLDLSTILAAPTRRAITAAAQQRGYPVADCYRAYNRFGRFWVLGQWVDVGRVLRVCGPAPGTTVLVTCGPGNAKETV